MDSFDDIVVGTGILGLAHAWRLHARGRRVLVVERGARAQGASIRNFGMIWPMGQPAGERLDTALRSRALWLEAATSAGLWHDPCGSLHVVHHADEEAVLREFAATAPDLGYQAQLISVDEATARCPRLRPDGIRAALYSQTEVNVDPRQAVAGLAAWLQTLGVSFRFQTAVVTTADGIVETTQGTWRADHVWICTGDDFSGPAAVGASNEPLVQTKLQMLAVATATPDAPLGAMLAAGLTLAHYDAFATCPSLPALRASLAARYPFAVAHGIHVMVSRNSIGELILGDSHIYGADIGPFDRADIDDEILRLLRSFVNLEDAHITRRWHGTYAKHRHSPWLVRDLDARTTLVTGVGGAGMTLSFGLADRTVAERLAG